MTTSSTETRGAGRQEKNTSPFKAIKYKDITFLSLRKPLGQDTGLCRSLFSPVELLSWSQAQKLGGNWGPAEPLLVFLFLSFFFLNANHKTVYKNELLNFLLRYSCPQVLS